MDILQGKPTIAVYCPFERKSKHVNSTETCNKLCGKYVDGSAGEIRCRRCYKIFEFRLEDGILITEKTSPTSVVAEPIPKLAKGGLIETDAVLVPRHEHVSIHYREIKELKDLAHTLPSEES